MTSLHVISGLGPPNKNPGYAYAVLPLLRHFIGRSCVACRRNDTEIGPQTRSTFLRDAMSIIKIQFDLICTGKEFSWLPYLRCVVEKHTSKRTKGRARRSTSCLDRRQLALFEIIHHNLESNLRQQSGTFNIPNLLIFVESNTILKFVFNR